MDFSRIKDRFKKENLEKALDFVRKNIRYFAAGALFIVLVTVLVSCVDPQEEGESVSGTEISEELETETETEEGYQVDAIEAVNQLISQYYTAYAAGDTDTLAALAAPMSENEKSYISMMSQYVESYQNITCYTKSGLDANSWLVWAYMEVKFEGIDTAAPGMELFYVRTNEDGELYIDNLYSNYNSSTKENGVDVSVQTLIDESNGASDIVALQQEIQAQYEAVVAADETLSEMVNTTIPTAVTDWMTALVTQGTEVADGSTEETEAVEETEETEETESTEESDSDNEEDGGQSNEEDGSGEEEEQPEKETLYATARINVRESADTSANKLGNIELGEAVVRIGTEGDWSIIEYNGSTGYVKSEYLVSDSGSLDDDGEEVAGIAEGTVITLKNSTNIRSGMGEEYEKIGTAYSGEKVTVVMSYAEGWTKVTWNNKTGYIKTSLLQ